MANNTERPKQHSEYARWSGLTFRMIAIIIVSTLGGHYIDGYFIFDRPYFTILAAIIATVISFVFLIQEANRA